MIARSSPVQTRCVGFLILFRSSVVERGPLEADVSGSNPDGTTTNKLSCSLVTKTSDSGSEDRWFESIQDNRVFQQGRRGCELKGTLGGQVVVANSSLIKAPVRVRDTSSNRVTIGILAEM